MTSHTEAFKALSDYNAYDGIVLLLTGKKDMNALHLAWKKKTAFAVALKYKNRYDTVALRLTLNSYIIVLLKIQLAALLLARKKRHGCLAATGALPVRHWAPQYVAAFFKKSFCQNILIQEIANILLIITVS
jgi:hypothetical protein